jgi:hypothetical protein
MAQLQSATSGRPGRDVDCASYDQNVAQRCVSSNSLGPLGSQVAWFALVEAGGAREQPANGVPATGCYEPALGSATDREQLEKRTVNR